MFIHITSEGKAGHIFMTKNRVSKSYLMAEPQIVSDITITIIKNRNMSIYVTRKLLVALTTSLEIKLQQIFQNIYLPY